MVVYRLGTYDGHRGTVWAVDVNWDSTKVLTAAGDATCKLWDCETGADYLKFWCGLCKIVWILILCVFQNNFL